MNQIIFTSYCPRNLQERFATKKLVATFKYFHPDLPFFLYEDEDINEVYKKYNVNLSNALPCLMLEAKRKFEAEYVCHIDSDSLVLGRLEEILKFDYEVTSPLNNCKFHTGDERQNRPKCIWDLPNNKYVNCGLSSCNSEKFLLQWIELNKRITDSGGIKAFWQADIQWYNYLFHYENFQSKILDPEDGNLFYGPSANFDSGNDYVAPSVTKEYGGNFKNWSSWQDIKFDKNKFWLDNREVKVIHKCGGGNYENGTKSDWDLFNPETTEILKKITSEYN